MYKPVTGKKLIVFLWILAALVIAYRAVIILWSVMVFPATVIVIVAALTVAVYLLWG